MDKGLLEINDSRQSIVLWWSAAFVMWAGLLATYFVDLDAYIWLGTEDALGENLTALFYGVSGLLILATTFSQMRSGRWRPGQATLPVLLSLFFIFIGGEEISWGQRLFGIATPESMVDKNVQGEMNLHNLEFFDRHSGLLSQHTALNIFCLLFGVVTPLAYRFWGFARRILDVLNVPVVQISASIFFIIGLAHGQTIAKIQTHWAHTEVKELIFSVGVLVFGIGYFLNRDRDEAGPSE